MAETGLDLGEIIKAARRKPHACAMLIGPEGPVIEAHAKKTPDLMRRAAKARGGGPKGAQGILTIEGKTLILTCEADDVPASLPRQVKRYLSEQGFPLKVIFALPSGGQLDDGEADPAPDGGAQDAPLVAGDGGSPPPLPDPARQAAIVARLKVAAQRIGAAGPGGADPSGRLIRGLQGVRAQVLARDLGAADAALTLIEAALAQRGPGVAPPNAASPTPPPAPPGMAAKPDPRQRATLQDVPPTYLARVKATAQRVAALVAVDPALARKLAAAILQVVLAFRLGDTPRAERLLGLTDATLRRATPAATAGQVSGTTASAQVPGTTAPVQDEQVAAKAEKLKAVFPGVPEPMLIAVAAELGTDVAESLLSNPKRRAHFFGQVLQEVGSGGNLSESLNYKPEALIKTFAYFKDNPEEATTLGRTDGKPADQEAIANRAYANRLGNGDVDSGDGYRYRGRGMIQLTGKAQYEAFTKAHAEMYGEEVDFVANPDLLAQPKYAVRSALWYWQKNGLFDIADEGVTEDVADKITRKVNKHTDSYEKRWKNTESLSTSGALEDEAGEPVTVPPPT